MKSLNELAKNPLLMGTVSVIGVVLIWQAVATFVIGNSFILPGPVDVADAVVDLAETGTIPEDLATSLLHFAIGIGAALLVGVPLGMAMGWFRIIDSLANPIIEVLRPIPPLAWIPFAIVWFGLTDLAAGFIVFAGAFFPVLINTYTGFRNVPKIFVEAGKVLGCTTDLSLIRHIAIPSSVPQIASGIRVATGVGWMCLVAAEIFGASKYGLGKQMWEYYSLHQMANVVVYMIILGLIGLAIDIIFRYYVDGRLLRWRSGEVL